MLSRRWESLDLVEDTENAAQVHVLRKHTAVCVCVCVCALCVCTCVRVYVCVCVCALWACACVCVYVCVRVRVCVCLWCLASLCLLVWKGQCYCNWALNVSPFLLLWSCTRLLFVQSCSPVLLLFFLSFFLSFFIVIYRLHQKVLKTLKSTETSQCCLRTFINQIFLLQNATNILLINKVVTSVLEIVA